MTAAKMNQSLPMAEARHNIDHEIMAILKARGILICRMLNISISLTHPFSWSLSLSRFLPLYLLHRLFLYLIACFQHNGLYMKCYRFYSVQMSKYYIKVVPSLSICHLRILLGICTCISCLMLSQCSSCQFALTNFIFIQISSNARFDAFQLFFMCFDIIA